MSTILKALRKLEHDQPARTLPDATPLDREVLEAEASERPRPLRRIALVMIAVLFSGLAGAGVTLAALTFWQARHQNIRDQSTPPAVAAAPVVAQPSARVEERREEPTVFVVADILKQRDVPSAAVEAPAELPPDHYAQHYAQNYAQPAPKLAELESTPSKLSYKAIEREFDSPLPGPLVLARRAPERDPVSELAALREARMSQAPAEVPAAEPPEPVERKVAAVQIEAPQAEPEPVAWSEPEPELETVDVAPEPVLVRDSVSDPVPSLSVMRTTWHPTQQRRRAELSVLEAGETRVIELKEGQSIGPFKVSEIGPTGVTFLHRGVEIQRRVGAPHQ